MPAIIDLPSLLTPISDHAPTGDDLSYSTRFGEIEEARRADEDLPQGDWAHPMKESEWLKVKDLCVELLRSRTKDLRLVAWLTEALTHLHGFRGLSTGLDATRELLITYWDALYPDARDDLAMRAGKLDWLAATLARVIPTITLTEASAGHYTSHHWNEAREVENARRRDAQAAEELVADGKTTYESIEKAVNETSGEFYRQLHGDLSNCTSALEQLSLVIEEKFQDYAPSFAAPREAVDQTFRLIDRIAREKGVLAETSSERASEAPLGHVGQGGDARAHGLLATRQEALSKLREVAHYFRTHEPHSPVALLAQRAAKWGNMPLEEWLQEVLKDSAELPRLFDLLDVKNPAQS